jgi:predicted ATPase
MKKLNSITLKNFKSIGSQEQTVKLSPITLLFGPNSVGKSTVLQSLIYLREIIFNRNLDADKTALGGEWVDLGGFKNIVHGRAQNEVILIKTEMDVVDEIGDRFLFAHSKSAELSDYPQPEEWLSKVSKIGLSVSVAWSEVLNRPIIENYSVEINGEFLGSIVCSKDCKQIYFSSLNMEHALFVNGPLIDEDNEDYKFCDLFKSCVNQSTIKQSSRSIYQILSKNRPFSHFKISSMERFMEDSGFDFLVLKKMSAELEERTTRAAHHLNLKVQAMLLEKRFENDSVEEFGTEHISIGLINQNDALVINKIPLVLEDDIWNGFEYWDGKYEVELITQVLSGLFVGSLDVMSDLLEDIIYLGPLRDMPSRDMTPQRTPDLSRWAKGLAAWELLYSTQSESVEEINKWLGKGHLDTGYEINVKQYRELCIDHPLMMYLDKDIEPEDQNIIKEFINELAIKTKVLLKEINTDLEVMPQDIGVGISQLIPVIVLSLLEENGIVAIEQPELHVHPRIQVELADLFISCVKDAALWGLKKKHPYHNIDCINVEKIFLLETHSEHLLLRLLRRIREFYSGEISNAGDFGIPKETVSVVYVESTDTGTKLTSQEINEEGDFDDDWPDGFFEERDEELFF